jgi:carbonic anhydrase
LYDIANLFNKEDSIELLVISYKLLGTRERFVIHHSNCGMETFTDGIIRDLLSRSLRTADAASAPSLKGRHHWDGHRIE